MVAKKVRVVKPAIKHKAFLRSRIERINAVLTKLEAEFEKAVRTMFAKGEQSSQELRKNFDEILEWLKNGQIYALANGTKETVTAEIHRLKTETLARVKEIETMASRNWFTEIKTGLSSLLERIQGNSLVETVRERASKSREQLLGVLHIPNQEQLHGVERRIDRLERKLHTLTKRAA